MHQSSLQMLIITTHHYRPNLPNLPPDERPPLCVSERISGRKSPTNYSYILGINDWVVWEQLEPFNLDGLD